MPESKLLLPLLLEELKKLKPSEVSSFCGEEFYNITKKRFLLGEFPKLAQFDITTTNISAQVIQLWVQQQLVEVALLKTQWDIQSSTESLLYRFFLKDFSVAIFAQSNEGTPHRQLLSEAFVLLWLLSLQEEEQKHWGLTDLQIQSLLGSFGSFLGQMPEHANPSPLKQSISVKALLVCVPELPFPLDDAGEKIPASTPQSGFIQGKLFKAFNSTHLKSRGQSSEASQLSSMIEKHGLAELQILHENGRILPIKDNDTLIRYLENHRSEEVDRRMLDKLCKMSDSDSLLFKTFERNKFNLIDKFIVEGKEVRIVFGYSPFQERHFFVGQSLTALPFGGIYQKPQLSLSLAGEQGQLQMRLEHPKELQGALVTNQIAYHPQTKKIFFHDLHQLKRDVLKFVDAHGLERQKHSDAMLAMREETYQIRGHERVYSLLQDLHTHFSKDLEIPPLKKRHILTLPTLHLSIDSGSFQLTHTIQDQDQLFRVSNLAPEWAQILCGVEKGLIATDARLPLEVSLSARRSQRQNELKFLKNSGLFLTILFSTLDWKLKHEPLGKSKPLFYEDLWQKLTLLLIPRNEAHRAESLNDLISVKIKKIAIDYIENLLDFLENEHESKLISNEEIIFVPGLVKEQAKVIHFWLQQMALLTKGEIFVKTHSKFLPLPWLEKTGQNASCVPYSFYVHRLDSKTDATPFIFRYSTLSPETTQDMPLSAWARIPQAYPDIDLQISGHPLESVSAEQFKVNFELTQTTEGDSPAENTPRIDWFDLNPKYFLNGKEISERDAKKLTHQGVLEYQGRFYVLNTESFPGQSALEFFWNRLQQGQQKNPRSFQNNELEVTPRKHHILELLALRRMGISFQGPKEWEKICDYYDKLSQPRGQLNLGTQLNQTLKPYQLAGVQWLWDLYQLRIGGILADDMGLGKTVQALSFLQYGHEQGSIKKVLIIVPVSLTFNWIAEAQKFTPNLNISVFDPRNLDTLNSNIIVCTYSLLSIHHKALEEFSYDVVIFDEAQYLKNIGTHRFKSSENIKAKFKVALTGTPIENNLAELYSLFHLVSAGLLGSRQDFKRNFVKPEELSQESLVFLKAKLKPLILRRRKQDLSLELPDKIENQIYVDFSEKQKELYRNTALSWSQKVNEAINQKGATQSKIYMLTALLRLRQVCSDPAALPSVVYKEVPPKISILIGMLEEITAEGHSAIIFTQFMSTFLRLKDLLKKHNILSFEMHGGTPRKDRETVLKAFSSEPSQQGCVLLMTLKTGGVGLNLTKASYVFHLEPWWNPAVENQATDRVHRLGQSKNVTVYRMIMKESVEEKVEILKKRKAQLFNNLFGDDYFSLESVEDSASTDQTATTAITKEDFDILVQ